MKSKTKIWLGVGAFVVAGMNSAGAEQQPVAPQHVRNGISDIALTRALAPSDVSSAAKKQGGEHGEHGKPAARKQGGEGGEGGEEGGAKGGASLPPDLDFALKIAQIRGHLLVGDQLVKERQWAAALPHFLHPSEELYGPLRPRLKDYKTPPFEAALKVLASIVKAKKGGADYANALKVVNDALAAADAGLREKQTNWTSFTVETALEVLKSAGGEYEEAIVKGRIAKPVEYQDARGFVWQAEGMIESIAPALEQKNKDALANVRTGLAELKKAWPTAMAPRMPAKDYGAVLSDISRIELAAGKLM
jgi:hypothetical protein